MNVYPIHKNQVCLSTEPSNQNSLNFSTPTYSANTDFLHDGSGSPKDNIKSIGIPLQAKEIYKATEEVLFNINTLKATPLKIKYPLEYKRWDNMKQRVKQGYIVDSRFCNFKDFLSYMGTIPNSQYTLDRINNENKTYSPENCRWADKATQNSNKGNNVLLIYKGETLTVAQWAHKTNQNSSKLYKRHKSGWTDEEIITGERKAKAIDPLSKTPWPNDNKFIWEKTY